MATLMPAAIDENFTPGGAATLKKPAAGQRKGLSARGAGMKASKVFQAGSSSGHSSSRKALGDIGNRRALGEITNSQGARKAASKGKHKAKARARPQELELPPIERMGLSDRDLPLDDLFPGLDTVFAKMMQSKQQRQSSDDLLAEVEFDYKLEYDSEPDRTRPSTPLPGDERQGEASSDLHINLLDFSFEPLDDDSFGV